MTKTVQFNFNNEADILELRMDEETGEVTIPSQDGLSFESMEKFAEYYAIARNVAADRLKNWVLTSDGSVYTFSLRAATAGVSAYDIRAELIDAINASAEGVHPLDVVSFRQEVENTNDIVDALANASNRELARDVYNVLDEAGLLTEEVYDEYDVVEEFMDEVNDKIGSYAIFAHTLNMNLASTKEAILDRIRASEIDPYDFIDQHNQRVALDSERANVSPYKPELLTALLLQEAVGVEGDDIVQKVRVAAQFARREKVNIRTIKVGRRYVKDTAEYVSVGSLTGESVRSVNGAPVIYTFDASVDQEVEAELASIDEEEVAFEVENDFEVEDEFDVDYE